MFLRTSELHIAHRFCTMEHVATLSGHFNAAHNRNDLFDSLDQINHFSQKYGKRFLSPVKTSFMVSDS